MKYAVGTWGNGIHLVDINLTTYAFAKDDHIYLQGKYVSDIIELQENILLATSYSDCGYYIIDLNKKEEYHLCKGFSPYALGVQKFP